MNTETIDSSEIKTFLQTAQDIFHELINERKAILRPEVSKKQLNQGLQKLLAIHNDQSIFFFSDLSSDLCNLDTKKLDSFLELQKLVITLSLVRGQSLNDKIEEDAITTGKEVQTPTNSEDQEHQDDKEIQDTELNQKESYFINDFESVEMSDVSTCLSEFSNELEIIKNNLKITCQAMLNGSITKITPGTDMIKTINITRRLKLEIIVLFMIYFSISCEISIPDFEQVLQLFTREEFYTIINKIIPKVYNCNLYIQYYSEFLNSIYCTLNQSKNRTIFLLSTLNIVDKQYPQLIIPFEERRENILKVLGWDTWNLEDCCDRIETRASVLITESPIEMCQKMSNLWMLLEGSFFLSFDDNFMAIYVFSSELSVFHEQLMRIFFIINRIDEVVREVGYLAYATKKFVNYYTQMYTDIHFLFVRLVRAINKNYEIYELDCDPISGKISKKLTPSVNIAAKLRELCVYMTCPLACLDSILRLNLDLTDLPILFAEEEERFIFTAQVQSLLVLHDFISNDREKFAEFMVELYPCLDRHFSRFHKSKKSDSQGPNTVLPPSYHLFTTKPPTYENINNPEPSNHLTIPIPNDEPENEENNCCCRSASNFGPAFLFIVFCIIIILIFMSQSK